MGLVQRSPNQIHTRTQNPPLPPPNPPSCGYPHTPAPAPTYEQREIATILQHQQTLRSELTSLSNSLQDTKKEVYQQRAVTSKMANFLAGMFGLPSNNGNGEKDVTSQGVDSTSNTAVTLVPHWASMVTPTRLMIEAVDVHNHNEAKKDNRPESSGRREKGSINNSSDSSSESIPLSKCVSRYVLY